MMSNMSNIIRNSHLTVKNMEISMNYVNGGPNERFDYIVNINRHNNSVLKQKNARARFQNVRVAYVVINK